MPYEFWLIAHLLIFAYWLGADLAVYYISGAIVDSNKPMEVRLYAARTMLVLDMVPRTALILSLLTGMVLASSVWLPRPVMGWWWLWPLLLAWLALNWTIFRFEHTQPGRRLVGIDFGVRIVVVLTCLGLAAGLWFGIGPFAALPWLAAKLAILALILTLGLIIRVQLRPFGPLFAKIAQGQADQATEHQLKQLIARVKGLVWLIWIALVAAAALGKLKPVF